MPTHNHLTRDIKPEGQCPACDVIHENERERRKRAAEALD
jgi:hypothetical protein